MESKLIPLEFLYLKFNQLLIEPVWNRNFQLSSIFIFYILPTFNRTSMESKPTNNRLYFLHGNLLIEPVWNRNAFSTICTLSSKRAFNRTSMESKQSFRPFELFSLETFNRTSMESKHTQRLVNNAVENSFNRTSIESKPLRHVRNPQGCFRLLIEPVWNRNIACNNGCFTAFNF